MNYVLDIHTHSIVSGHAYSTIQEMIYAAKEKGLAFRHFRTRTCHARHL